MKEPIVDGLDEIISLLVEGVDGSLHGGYFAVGRGGISSLVLFVPEIEVGTMLALDEGAERGVGGGGSAGLMPLSGPEYLRVRELSQVLPLGCDLHLPTTLPAALVKD